MTVSVKSPEFLDLLRFHSLCFGEDGAWFMGEVGYEGLEGRFADGLTCLPSQKCGSQHPAIVA